MKLLIKLGGTLLDSEQSRCQLALEIAGLASRQHQVAVVHGGGKQLSRYLEKQGVASRFVNGFRVTTPETLDGVIKVLAGEVNLQLVSALEQAGARAVGLTGADDGLVRAVQLSPELGAVGRVDRVRPDLLDLLTSHRYVPVVACIGSGPHGEVYNVNADQMAVACAAWFLADRLIFLTDVEGVLDADKRLIPSLSAAEAAALIEGGVATGGMEAKLRACTAAVRQGIPKVQIAPGARRHILDDILAGRCAGTTISSGS